MEIKVTIRRSGKWVHDQRVARGENVPQDIAVPVEVSQLSEATRKRLLDWKGEYCDIKQLNCDTDLTPYRGTGGHGYYSFCCNSDTPTAAEIDVAIAGAFAELDVDRAKMLADEAARNERKAREQAEKEAAAKRLTDARELLSAELSQLKADNVRLIRYRDELSEFLAEVPLDALRGTVKRLVSAESEIESRIKTIEDAASAWIFKRDDE